ncbi:hypothetical protein KJ641_01680 [Patescibacteria group bacterium]|nr:hypothetical protein [Patescibacteria group bacterium]MBU1895561.1 hypothetical protein [Patescibacteria group bacterium]
MKENRNFIRNLALFALIAGVVGISAVGAVGPQDNENKEGRQFDPERKVQMEENRATMQEVLSSGDYNAFLELVGDKPIAENITADNFARFVEMHELMQAGDKEGAQAIAEELGLPAKPVKFKKKRAFHLGQIIKDGGFKDVDGNGVCTFEENRPVAEEVIAG